MRVARSTTQIWFSVSQSKTPPLLMNATDFPSGENCGEVSMPGRTTSGIIDGQERSSHLLFASTMNRSLWKESSMLLLGTRTTTRLLPSGDQATPCTEKSQQVMRRMALSATSTM